MSFKDLLTPAMVYGLNALEPFLRQATVERVSATTGIELNSGDLPRVVIVDNAATQETISHIAPDIIPVIKSSVPTLLGLNTVQVSIHPEVLAHRTDERCQNAGGVVNIIQSAATHQISAEDAPSRFVQVTFAGIVAETTLDTMPECRDQIVSTPGVKLQIVNRAIELQQGAMLVLK
ncbi:hypothetical protein A2160_05135 [Candidatus Beckwithbacteria bacterium RBG_13_42_9]|uniref:Uncharacterized protein n=1 Tax=Candidatus Beckwithbacteria bacterium RBG_13_42_9 TaxID=1797457 RepID=A0A1F5E6H2_9BACT|nr:MAG: hypothetical protein A2160_05135 [Candidatus Beckwithbacteria bacterium RBG_13_42_9]